MQRQPSLHTPPTPPAQGSRVGPAWQGSCWSRDQLQAPGPRPHVPGPGASLAFPGPSWAWPLSGASCATMGGAWEGESPLLFLHLPGESAGLRP